jgi:hypothetical protein
MSAADLIDSAYGSGLTIHLHGSDLKITGRQEIIAAWIPAIRAQKIEVIAELEVRHHGWIIHFDQCEKTVFYHPAVSCARVLEQYPTAVKAEPIIKPNRQITPAERTELHKLIAGVLADVPEEIEEAFTAALADIDPALICWRSLAEEAATQ